MGRGHTAGLTCDHRWGHLELHKANPCQNPRFRPCAGHKLGIKECVGELRLENSVLERVRIALVTGANRGMGFETCRQLARLEYRVVLTARNPV